MDIHADKCKQCDINKKIIDSDCESSLDSDKIDFCDDLVFLYSVD